MLHTLFLPKYEDGKKIVSVPTRLLKRWSGDFAVLKQPNRSNAGVRYQGHPLRGTCGQWLGY
jgi:hypothetical protein